MKNNIFEIYFEDISKEDLFLIYEDFNNSKKIGSRCELLVPCAKWIQNMLVGSDLTVSECLSLAEKCFFGEVAKRYFK